MDRKKGSWRAPANDSGELVGYNDLARVSFGIRTVHYLVRETIQNSLDARRDDAEGAVIVSFQSFDIPRESAPRRVTVTKECITEGAAPIIENAAAG